MEDDTTDVPPERPDSLLPYDIWTEDALRHVVITAVAFVASNGLPGEHHFYISFRTDARDVSIPARLTAQYPHEMTIVLQHQYSDLQVDELRESFSVRLSFGGIPSTLQIPFAAVTGFADPHVQFGLRFRPPEESAANDEGVPEETQDAAEAPTSEPESADATETPASEPQVVSLDAFRKRSPKDN